MPTWADKFHIGIEKERNELMENLSMLVSGGMSIPAALDAVSRETHSGAMQKILSVLRDEIQGGSPLWKAFARTGLFDEHTIALVRLGEKSGKLSENLALIAIEEEKDAELRSKIRSAMMYPVFVLSLTVIVGVALAWFILPRLARVFAQLGIALPAITKGLIAVGGFLGTYGVVALPLFFVVLGLVVYFLFYYQKTKFIGQTALFAFPGVRRLLREIELARFGYLLGTLLDAGLPITQALDSLQKATFFPPYKKLYAHLRDSIEEGNSFSKSFLNYKQSVILVPTSIQQLIGAGEQSGKLSETLLKISAIFEARTENTAKNLTVILEPILLVIVWLGVVAVALAVILPIYSLIGNLNTDPAQQVKSAQPTRVPSPPTAPQQQKEQPVTTLTITPPESVSFVNIRSGSSLMGKIIGQALPGETYEFTDEADGWYTIVLSTGERGFIFGDYVTQTQP